MVTIINNIKVNLISQSKLSICQLHNNDTHITNLNSNKSIFNDLNIFPGSTHYFYIFFSFLFYILFTFFFSKCLYYAIDDHALYYLYSNCVQLIL